MIKSEIGTFGTATGTQGIGQDQAIIMDATDGQRIDQITPIAAAGIEQSQRSSIHEGAGTIGIADTAIADKK